MFEATASGALAVGLPITGAEYNNFTVVSETASMAMGAGILGWTLDTAGDTDVIEVVLNL